MNTVYNLVSSQYKWLKKESRSFKNLITEQLLVQFSKQTQHNFKKQILQHKSAIQHVTKSLHLCFKIWQPVM